MDTPVNINRHLTCSDYVGPKYYPFQTFILKTGESVVIESKEDMMLVFVDTKSATYELDDLLYKKTAPFFMFLEDEKEVTLEVTRKTRVSTLRFSRPTAFCPSYSIYHLKAYAPNSMVHTTLEIVEPLQHLLDSMVRYYDDDLCCGVLMENKLKEVFFVISAYYEPERLGQLLAPLLRREVDFKEFVAQNYLNVEKVQDLADIRGVSLRAFNEEFKATYGMPPYTWMLQQKANLVEERLLNGVPFADIIKEFHFSSPSHFTVFCKKHFGLTPTQKKRELLRERKLRQQENVRRNRAGRKG